MPQGGVETISIVGTWPAPFGAFLMVHYKSHCLVPMGEADGTTNKCRHLCAVRLVAQSCLTPCDPMNCSPSGSSFHGDSPGQNTGVGCHALLQGIFPKQGSNPQSLMSRSLAGGFFTTSATWEAHSTPHCISSLGWIIKTKLTLFFLSRKIFFCIHICR